MSLLPFSPEQIEDLFRRCADQRSGEVGVLAGPGAQVVERLLGLDGHAVEAKQEGLRRRISLAPDEPVVERGEQRLADIGERDDGLHRGVVLGSCVQEFPSAREEFFRRQVRGRLRLPPLDDSHEARVGVLAPARHSAPFPAAHQEPEGSGGFHEETPERAKRVVVIVVVGVTVDRGDPNILEPVDDFPCKRE
jgi:hypothetical protein